MSEHTASYPYPVMGSGRLDYVSGCSYMTSDWSVASGHVELTHQIEGKSLISRLIKEGKAGFGCVVVIPSTMYREIFSCEEMELLSAKHAFQIKQRNRSIQSIKFLPIVFYKGEDKEFAANSSMGTDEIWNGQTFTLQKGAIIARDAWYEIEFGAAHLLKVNNDNKLKKGMMEVEISSQDGGYFDVRLSSDLYEGFQIANTQGMSEHKNSILTHALSVGLAKMAGGSDWEIENFQVLKRTLEEEHGIPWDDETGFDPCKAACAYLPHCFTKSTESEEE